MKKLVFLLMLLLTANLPAQTLERSYAQYLQEIDSTPSLIGTWINGYDQRNENGQGGIQWSMITFNKDSTFTTMIRYIDEKGTYLVAGLEKPTSGLWTVITALGEELICVKRDSNGAAPLMLERQTHCQPFTFNQVHDNGEDEDVVILTWGRVNFVQPKSKMLELMNRTPLTGTEPEE